RSCGSAEEVGPAPMDWTYRCGRRAAFLPTRTIRSPSGNQRTVPIDEKSPPGRTRADPGPVGTSVKVLNGGFGEMSAHFLACERARAHPSAKSTGGDPSSVRK